MKKNILIKCPYCGRQYLPGQLFVPNEFLGQPTDVIRNSNGEIVGFQGSTMDTTEEYICDTCDNKFRIEASINFKVTKVDEDFDDCTVSLKD